MQQIRNKVDYMKVVKETDNTRNSVVKKKKSVENV